MALHFGATGLKDENGKAYLISNRVLLEKCLENPSDEIRVSVIIFEAITELTGERVIKRNYNQSKLYCWLENRIREDERYKSAKAKKMEECEKNRKLRKGYVENKKAGLVAEDLMRQKRLRLKNYYRSKPKMLH